MSLTDEISATINKNLPAEVGNVLKERLVQAEKDALNLEAANQQLKVSFSNITNLQKELSEVKSKLAQYVSREDELVKRESNINTLELTAKFEQEKTALTKDLFGMVFANRVIREDALVTRKHTSAYNGNSSEYYSQIPEQRTVVEG